MTDNHRPNHFTDQEINYLNAQRLGRLATVSADGQPHVVPVGFRYDPATGTIMVGGHNFASTKKVRDIHANPRVAFVVDDLASIDPWRVRGITVRGVAEFFTDGGAKIGPGFDPAFVRITPRRIVAWGIETDQFEPVRRSIP